MRLNRRASVLQSDTKSISLESLMQRGVFDERDIDYLNHLEIKPVSEEALESAYIATEGIIRAQLHDAGSVITDAYRETKGWFLGIESKRKYIEEICEDLVDWLKDKDMEYRDMNLDMGAFYTWMKTAEIFYWRYYFLLDDSTWKRMVQDLKADRVSDLESIYSIDFSARKQITNKLDSIRDIKGLIKVVETYKDRSNTFFELILKRKIKIKSFPFQVILLGATDLRRTAKKIVNLAI